MNLIFITTTSGSIWHGNRKFEGNEIFLRPKIKSFQNYRRTLAQKETESSSFSGNKSFNLKPLNQFNEVHLICVCGVYLKII